MPKRNCFDSFFAQETKAKMARKWFEFRKIIYCSEVSFQLILVILLVLDVPLLCSGNYHDRESRKLFGGYRITPSYCKASRAAKYNRGNTICMFNHECTSRGGEVVGTCMDGFLFGACCQLKSDSQSHIPKGPGVVMTSYLDYPDPEGELTDYDADQLSDWHNSFKPIVTPGYKPAYSSTNKPEDLSTEAEIINEGVNQIANTLLSSPPKDNGYKPKPEYNFSTINHVSADTILVNPNGTIVDNIARPSDFNVQISSMQTKPTVAPSTTSSTQQTVSTHYPVRPVFKPKPTKATTENYVMVSTVTREEEASSINSIMQMLNDSTPSVKEDVTSPGYDAAETKSSPSPYTHSTLYSSSYYPTSHYVTQSSSHYTKPSTGHYVTLKPTSFATRKPSTTKKPTTVYVKPSTLKPYVSSQKPPYEYVTSSNIMEYSSPTPSQSTSQAIDNFNKYPTDPSEFTDSVTTFSYVSSSTTEKPTVTTRKPPSTSYITGSPHTRRPITPPGSYETYDTSSDTFSSATPTVIVINGFQTQKPTEETQFIEISQEPFKKPATITVNNNIASTNNIYMNKPPSYEQPSSPTVVITPKPAPNTTPYPIKSSTRPPVTSTSRPATVISVRPDSISIRPVSSTTAATYTTASFDFNEYSPTTFKPEQQTSPDDLINFPPVRNPMLNASGSNPALYNTSTFSDNELSDLDLIHELEFTTPTWHEDDKLNDKMSAFVSKIVGSLQGTFQELHDIVILDKKQNATAVRTTTVKPKKTVATTKRPLTTKKPVKLTPTTRKPTVKTTKKPTRLTTLARRTTTTIAPPTTTVVTTRKPVVTTKRTKPTRRVTTTTQAPTSTTELQDEITTENFVDQNIDYNDKNLCGVKPLSKSGRIVGGKNAKFGEWPWQVLVRESTWLGLFTKNKCGGVLITNRFVTTAAHCQPGFLASLVAVFGENDISGDKEPKTPVTRNVRRVIVHREYDAATFENDLALLELESPIKFDAHIVPICMPPDEGDYTGRMATVTGWGRLKYGGGVPAVLQEVQVPVIENSACQEMFQTAGHSKKILNSFICAGYANGQKDSCEGDSGGPLVLQRDDGKWQLVGTVSHGIKCAAPFLPGVYMRTTYYKPWLKSITGVRR